MRLRGAQLGDVFEELDAPGAGRPRPLLEAAIARVEAGRSGGLVVAHLDRFGRSLLEGLVAIERISSLTIGLAVSAFSRTLRSFAV